MLFVLSVISFLTITVKDQLRSKLLLKITRSRSGIPEIAHRCNLNPTSQPPSESSYVKTDATSGKSVYDLLFESVNANDARPTVYGLSPLVRFKIRTPASRLQSRRRSNLMVPLERASTVCYLKVSTKITYEAPLTRYRRFCTGTIFDPDPSAQWGHRIPKVKPDLDPQDMGSYSTLIVTMGLSSTVNPQCTNAADGRTDRQTDRHRDYNISM